MSCKVSLQVLYDKIHQLVVGVYSFFFFCFIAFRLYDSQLMEPASWDYCIKMSVKVQFKKKKRKIKILYNSLALRIYVENQLTFLQY